MTLRKTFLASLSISALSLAAPALAQDAEAPATASAPAETMPSVGAQVMDTDGGTVGTITAVDGDGVTLRTDRHEIRLPLTSMTAHEGNFLIAMTQAEANAAADQAQAEARQSITAGAVVRDTSGGTVGTIEEVDAEFATIRLSNGAVKLPLAALAPTPTGPVVAVTAAELEAQVSAGASADAGAAQ